MASCPSHLAQTGRKTDIQAINFEFCSPDVGSYLHHSALLWQNVEIVHVLVAEVSEVVRLVPPPPPSPPAR